MNLNRTVAVCPVRRVSMPDSVPDMDSIAAAWRTTPQWITGWYPGATVVEWCRITTSASNSRVALGSSCPSIATIPYVERESCAFAREEGCTYVMNGRSRMTMDPRIVGG